MPEQDSKSEKILQRETCHLGTQATYFSHHPMLQHCTSCRHDWPGAGLNGGLAQLGGDETPYETWGSHANWSAELAEARQYIKSLPLSCPWGPAGQWPSGNFWLALGRKRFTHP